MRNQYAALPFRVDPEKGLQILLITSRETRRWVIPKGNRVGRLKGHESASLEAYEEAGLEGSLAETPIGHYPYDKVRRSGESDPVLVTVYALKVDHQHYHWPERTERTSRWVPPGRAAMMVDEPELKQLILDFDPANSDFPTIRTSVKGKGQPNGGLKMLGMLRAIMPREDRFFDMFARQADIIVAGADAMTAMFAGAEGIAESCRRIEEFEHRADDVTRDVLVAVRRSFITPFDRSAITALASAMDDSLDEMWHTAKAISRYEVKSFEPELLDMSRYAAEAARLVREAIPLMRRVGRNGQRLHEITEKIVHLEGQADTLHERGLKALYQAHGADRAMEFIVGREIFSHVERVLDRLEDVADEIQGIVIDHA